MSLNSSEYNYDFARIIYIRVNHEGIKLPHVAVIGSPKPLTPKARLDPSIVNVLDLCTDSALVRTIMKQFENKLIASRTDMEELYFDIRARVKEFLHQIGMLPLTMRGKTNGEGCVN